jgi:Tol biopolymer transport system component
MQVSADGTNLRQAVAPVSNLRRNAAVSVANPLVQQMIADPIHVASKVEGLKSLAGQMIFNPVLSPTGDRIVFQAGREGMFVVNADGSGLRNLGAQFERATWTADGQFVVTQVEGNDGTFITSGKLFAINVSTGAVSPFLVSDKYIALNPVISPDGSRLVFEEYTTGAIFIMDIK